MKYRKEIDGLRALALLPVIFFHAGFSLFGGGFVGVDVFFVISGYLITSIIFNEIDSGSFTLAGFYERRARRILPALLVVIFSSLFFAWLFMLPSDMEDFSQSISSCLVFMSNIFFWRGFGYFNPAIEIKPLIHTWSLAIEEQYYLIFPLFLLITWRFGKKAIFSMLFVIALISLILAQWGALRHPMANFYLLPFRVWEFFVGAALVFFLKEDTLFTFPKVPYINEIASLVGLSLIMFSVTFLSKATPYPSFYTLLPTVGAALIIFFSNDQTITGKLLSHKALVSIGLVSYSAYLWHQPIFAFSRLRIIDDISFFTWCLLILLTFLLALVSYKYIEQPFRDKRIVNRSIFIQLVTVSFVMLFLFNLGAWYTQGYDFRRTEANILFKDIDSKIQWNKGLHADCTGNFPPSTNCKTSDSPEVLLWGDSYAMHLAQGLISSNPQVQVVQMTRVSCAPMFDIAHVGGEYTLFEAQKCMEFNAQVKQWLPNQKSIKYAVLSSPFTQYLRNDNELLINGAFSSPDPVVVKRHLLSTLNYIRSLNITPVIVSPTPSTNKDFGRCLVKSLISNSPLNHCDFALDSVTSDQIEVNDLLSQISENYKVIWLKDYICIDGICRTSIDGTFIYSDAGHLSIEGASLLGSKMNFYQLIKQSEHE